MATTTTIRTELLTKNLEADYTSHPAELVRGGVSLLEFSPDLITYPQHRRSTRSTPPRTCVMQYPRIASSHPISGHSGTSFATSGSQEH